MTPTSKNIWRRKVIGLLTKLDKVDVVLNPNKFANRSVDFAGFRISYNSMKPLSKYWNAVANFSTSNIDVRG